MISDTGSTTGAATDDWQLQYSLNSGTWTDVTTSSSVVKAYDNSNLTDGAATTQRLSGGIGSFGAGEISEDGLVDDLQIIATNWTEFLFALKIVSADVANADVITFRVLYNATTSHSTYYSRSYTKKL